jgi:two-component system, NarL family, response regulator NreC
MPVRRDRDGAGTGLNEGETITIVLAEDHEIVREGVRMVLESEPDFEVVAEAGDSDAALRYVNGHKPTILVLDINMPGRPTLEMIPEVAEISPKTSVVVLTMQNEAAFAREAFRNGARGFVVKHAAARELVDAVRQVVAGETYINPQLGARLAAEPDAPSGPPGGLTEREAQILGLIALGNTNPQIAEQLVISVRTVETHRTNIQHKLGISQRSDLVRYALDHDLLDR